MIITQCRLLGSNSKYASFARYRPVKFVLKSIPLCMVFTRIFRASCATALHTPGKLYVFPYSLSSANLAPIEPKTIPLTARATAGRVQSGRTFIYIKAGYT